MRKINVPYRPEKIPHETIVMLGCIAVITGLFVSRALISMGMIGLTANALLHEGFGNNFRRFLHRPHLLLLTGYFFLMAISAVWSSNMDYLSERLQILLPFLFLPFAFHSMRELPARLTHGLFVFFILLLTTGMCWSLWHYLQAKNLYDIGYGFSQSIPTPFKNDHIRFSLAVVLGIALSVNLLTRSTARIHQFLHGFFILFAILYLHILAAKSGLLIFYCYTIILLIRLCLDKDRRRTGMVLLTLLILLPVLMFRISNTFRNKIGYFRYSITMMMNSAKDANVSDEGRLISYRYAAEAIWQHPLTGVGLGDVMDEMQKAYDRDFRDRNVTVLLPHNQFLMAGMAAGIPGILYLLVMMFSLFQTCIRKDFLSVAFILMMLLSMMFEPLFETQYGTCMFVFILLLLLQRRDVAT